MKYYVYNKKGNAPRKKHNSYESALQEAKRLALQEGRSIEILAVAGRVKTTVTTEVQDFRNEEPSDKCPLNIISVFSPRDRLNELKKVPCTPDGDVDYWHYAKLLCEKDGGRLPTMKELAQLASYIYGEDIDMFEDRNNLDGYKNMPWKLKDLMTNEYGFYLWSGEEDSNYTAWTRYFDAGETSYYNLNRNGTIYLALCLRDENKENRDV